MQKPLMPTALDGLIRNEIDCAERLGLALEAERDALVSGDPEALEQISSDKEALLREMDTRVADHARFLTRQGLPAGKEGTEALLARLPADAPERELWGRLQDTARRCRAQNEVNGNILSLRRARVQRSLEILRGASDSARTYGKGGESRLAGGSHSIGKV